MQPWQPAPKKRNRGKLVALVAVGVLLLGGVAFAGVTLVNKTSAAPDAMASMVPANDQLYVTAYLDPGADQKINLRNLLQRFPAMKGKDATQQIDSGLEQLLQPTGLSYAEDVKPWLGTQIAVAGRLDDSGNPDAAVLIATKDDAKTLQTMKRVEGLSKNAELTWTSTSYKGVEIREGHAPQSNGGGSALASITSPAYAVVDHTLVVATSLDRLQRVIDADQGSSDDLASDPNFQKARGALPDQVLGMAYVNVGGLIDAYLPQLEAGLGFADLPSGCGSDQLTKSLDSLRAFRGLAMGLSAQTDGLQLDAGLSMDRTKLPSAAASAVDSADHENAGLSFVPKDALGAVAVNGAGVLDQELSTVGKCQPDVKKQLDEYGVPAILSNLAGDMTLEVRPGAKGTPGGALIAAVKDEAKMRSSLDTLATKLLQLNGSSDKPKSETYQGVTIESAQLTPQDEVQPSWAVTDGVVIIATSPDEVKAAIDAHAGGDITTSPNFQQAASHVDLNSPDLVYADVSKILGAVESSMDSSGRQEFQQIAENLQPIKATILQAGVDGDVLSVRWFVLVP